MRENYSPKQSSDTSDFPGENSLSGELSPDSFDFESEYSNILNEIGGVGLFQLFIVTTIISGLNSTTFVYNCLGYLELQPQY